jgi:chromosome segregation ATPase
LDRLDILSSIKEQKEKIEKAIGDIATNKDAITDLLAKIEGIVDNEGSINETIAGLLQETDGIKAEINDKISSSKDYVDNAFGVLKDTISNIENTLSENKDETKAKLEKLFKEIVSINEKVILKEDFDKNINKVNELITELAEENNVILDFLTQSKNDIADIYKEAKALHLKNVEQDKQIQDLKKATAANKELISNNTINIREDIDELKTSHIEQINALSAELKKLKDEGKNNKSDDATTRSVVERLSDIIDGLLIEDEKVNSRITFVLNELNTKITKLNKRWTAAFIPITICSLALGIVGLMV